VLPLKPVTLGDYVDYGYRCEAELGQCNADKAGVVREVEQAEQRRETKKEK